MSVFAPEEAMSDSGNHPPLEELAAYIDGMLSEEEAARVAEHISECEDCFFVYSETVRFQLEHPEEAEDPVPDPGKVVPFPEKAGEPQRRKRFPWWVGPAIAAVLVLAVGFPLYRSLNPQGMPEMTTAELLKPVQGIAYDKDLLYGYRVFRGENEDSRISWEGTQTSVMSGALLLDLRLSLEGEDLKQSADLLRTVGGAIEKIDIPPSDGSLLIQEANRLSSPADLQRIPAEVDKWEAEIRAGNWIVDPDYFAFGQWAEAGRLAAKLQKREFFNSEENRRVLSYVLRSKEMDVDEDVVSQLKEIQSLWDKGDLRSQDFGTLAEKFKSVLGAYDFTS